MIPEGKHVIANRGYTRKHKTTAVLSTSNSSILPKSASSRVVHEQGMNHLMQSLRISKCWTKNRWWMILDGSLSTGLRSTSSCGLLGGWVSEKCIGRLSHHRCASNCSIAKQASDFHHALFALNRTAVRCPWVVSIITPWQQLRV